MSSRRQWHLEDSNGGVYLSWYEASEAMVADNSLEFTEHWLFAGEEQSEPCTQNVRRLCGLDKRTRFPSTTAKLTPF